MKKGLTCLIVLVFLGIIFLIGSVETSQAQEKYPTKPIDIIVPLSPGGGTDLSTRLTADYLNKKWKVPINVVNRPGGNTITGQLQVMQSAPDGYTMLAEHMAGSVLVGVAVKDLPFKVMDRTFVATVAAFPEMLIVPYDSPYKTLQELADAIKKNPEKITWGSQGGVSGLDANVRQFFKAINVDISKTKPVMAQGGATVAVLVAQGSVTFGGCSVVSAIPHIQGKTMRGLAVVGNKRSPKLPDVPCAGELGFPLTMVTWVGISGPPKIPAFVVNTWEKSIQEMVVNKDFVAKVEGLGAFVSYRDARATKETVENSAAEARELWGVK